MSQPGPGPTKAKPSFIRKLLPEVEAWEREGLISREAASLLRSRYPDPGPTDWRGRLVTTLSVMAATLLGCGVILFFASNWEAIPRFGKLCLILVAMVGTYAAGYELRYRRGYEKAGGAIVFLGTILFGAAIYLVAQAFNIREHFSNGLMLWAVGILPLAILIRNPYILILFTGVFCAWSGTESFAFANFGVFPLLVYLGVVLPLAYRFQHRIAVFAGIAAVTFFVFEGPIFQSIYVRDGSPYIYAALAVCHGALLWVVGTMHARSEGFSRYAELYRLPGLILILGILYLLSFSGINKELLEEMQATPREYWIAIAMCGAVLVSALGFMVYSLHKNLLDVSSYRSMIAAMATGALVFIFALAIAPGLDHQYNSPDATLVAVGFNLLLFAVIVGLVLFGYVTSKPLIINLGIAAFAVLVVTRYVDWCWDMMPTSLFFIVGGGLLLAGGILLERQRKRLVETSREAA